MSSRSDLRQDLHLEFVVPGHSVLSLATHYDGSRPRRVERDRSFHGDASPRMAHRVDAPLHLPDGDQPGADTQLLDGGRIRCVTRVDGQAHFHDFRLPMIGEMPKVELVLVPSGGFWGGHGEPGILPFQAAVLNAVFALTGKRIRTLPLRKEHLRPA